jgi:hypothetical protein
MHIPDSLIPYLCFFSLMVLLLQAYFTGNASIDVKFRRVRATIVAVEEQ